MNCFTSLFWMCSSLCFIIKQILTSNKWLVNANQLVYNPYKVPLFCNMRLWETWADYKTVPLLLSPWEGEQTFLLYRNTDKESDMYFILLFHSFAVHKGIHKLTSWFDMIGICPNDRGRHVFMCNCLIHVYLKSSFTQAVSSVWYCSAGDGNKLDMEASNMWSR